MLCELAGFGDQLCLVGWSVDLLNIMSCSAPLATVLVLQAFSCFDAYHSISSLMNTVEGYINIE